MEAKHPDEQVIADLRKSLAWLDMVMATLDEAVLVVGEDMRVMFANDAAANLVNRPRILLLGLYIWEAVPLYDNGELLTKQHFLEALREREKKTFVKHTHELRTAHEKLLVDVAVGYIQNIRQAVFVVQDVTQREKIEQDRIRLAEERAYRKEAERFRTLIELSADAIQLVDSKGNILYTSDSIQQVLGYTPEEILSHTVVEYIHPDDVNYFVTRLEQLLQEPGSQITAQYRVRHKNGTWAWVEATGINHLKTHNIHAVVGNFRNITERKKLEQQKDEFLSTASHELKTPVTSVKAYGQTLQVMFQRRGDEQAAAHLGKMDAQLNKLAHLIEDLLDVTKIEGGKLQFIEEEFDFNELVEEIVVEMQRTTDIHTLSKRFANSKKVNGDRNRIGQVITNLISNAIKYSPQSNSIIIETEATEKDVTLRVRDFGLGISSEDQQRIFERFYRIEGEKRETFPGLGLGLYISAEIIQRHRGKIWVESTKGAGATFCFQIPITTKKEL